MSKKIQFLFNDEYFLVINKPAGLLVIPTPKKEQNTLDNLAKKQYGDSLYPCHRLDRETSGAIIFAYGKKNQQLMMNEFKKFKVKKKYIAFVRGRIRSQGGQISIPIADFHQKKYSKHVKRKSATTFYKVIKRAKKFSVVEVQPKTGRTNQIRIHFSEIGHPLLGERVYAYRKDFEVDFRRLALHASEVQFRHPVLRKQIKVCVELPLDMQSFIEKYK